MSKILVVLAVVMSSVSFGQTFLLQEDFSSGIPAGWQVIDEDGLTPEAQVNQFTQAWIINENSSDTTIASTSYYTDTTMQSEDYIILPKMSIATFTKLSWDARSIDASFPDDYYVLLSTTDSLTSSFTDTLLDVPHENFIWNRRSIMLDTMGYANQDVWIAFRNYTTNGYILELDNIWVEVSDNASVSSEESFDFKIYPNPVENEIVIDIVEPLKATILSVSGATLLTSTDNKIDVSTFPSGYYFITVTTENGTASSPFIKK
jgi:hypothetical protein